MAILRVRTVFVGVTGSPWLSTLWFAGATASPTQAEADAAVAAAGAFWGAVDANMSNLVTWSTEPSVGVIDLSGVQTGAYTTTPQTGTGASAGSLLPFAVQGLIRTLTGSFVGGRQIRGRIFVPGLTELQTGAGVMDSATITAFNLAISNLIADVNSSLVVFSRVNNAVSTVIAGSTWNQLAVLRSRRD